VDVVRPDGHFEAEDRVSVWIGSFPSRRDFDDYMAERWSESDEDSFPECFFWQDLGLLWHDHDFQEAIFGQEVIAVGSLTLSLSWSDSFREPLLLACAERGIDKGNAIVAMYEFDYPKTPAFRSPFLSYVGSFPYSTGGHPFRRNYFRS